MRKFAGAFSAAVALITAGLWSGPAIAQEPAHNWTGFYAGVNVGRGWGTAGGVSWVGDNVGNGSAGAFMLNGAFANRTSSRPAFYDQSTGSKGFLGGGQLGYNWQSQPNGLVIGFETDFQWSGVDGTVTNTGAAFGNNFSATSKQDLNWFGTVRGRLGVPISDRFMPFITGGLAYGRIDTSASIGFRPPGPVSIVGTTFFSCPGGTCSMVGSSNNTELGWTAGGGFELVVWRNTTFKFEYLHIDLGDQTAKLVPVAPASGTAFAFAKFDNTFDIVRLGLNFKF